MKALDSTGQEVKPRDVVTNNAGEPGVVVKIAQGKTLIHLEVSMGDPAAFHPKDAGRPIVTAESRLWKLAPKPEPKPEPKAAAEPTK